MEVERLVAEIYLVFAHRFREDLDFWEDLSLEELEHINILNLVETYGPFEDDESDAPKLSKEEAIMRTLSYIHGVKERVNAAPLTRVSTFKYALDLEDTMVEMYLNELKELERMDKSKEMQRILTEERTHNEMIVQYMENNGLAHYS